MAVKFLGAGGASVTNFGPTADGKTFAGKAPAGASVAVSTDNFATTAATVIADPSGLWSYTFGAAPAVGTVVSARAAVQADSTVPPQALMLQALLLSSTAATVGQTFSATVSGRTAGSTLSLSGAGASGLSVSGTTVSGTPTSAGPVDLIETLAGAANSPRTTSGAATVSAPAIINMTGAAPRVAISDASYWIRTGGTLARTTDTAYETNLKNSSANKTIPFPTTQAIPSGSIGYVSMKLDATTTDSPPLFINWDGNTALPSATSPVTPTVWYSDDSVTGSPDDGTWTQYPASQFTLFRPTAATDAGYTGRAQRLFHVGEPPGRWRQVRFDVTVSGATQAMSPHISCSSGQWLWVLGNSVIRNQYSSISTINAQRAAIIAAVSGADPFFFATCRSGSNQQGILDEQVDPVLASATLKKFLRGVYCNPWLGDIAFSGARPYSAATQATRDAIRARSDAIFAKVKSIGVTVVASDMTWGNYLTFAPTMSSDIDLQSANGNTPWMCNVTGPGHKASLPSAWDPAYDWPIVSQAASMSNLGTAGYGANDDVHPNGTPGFTTFRSAEAPNWRLLYGQAAGANTMQSIIAGLGSSTTTAKKARAQAVFDMLVAAYPTGDTTAASNRTTLRSQLDSVPAA